jgi:hypothetical protein
MKRLLLIAMIVLLSSSIIFAQTTTTIPTTTTAPVTTTTAPVTTTSSITAQDFCKGLADYDQDVDANDVTIFLSHFGRSPFNNPCPPDGPTPVPQTGQTTSYATGDDGDLQRGVALVTPRFTDNGDGTVTDNQTGLIWLKDADCFGTRTWSNALSDCNGLADGSCGLTDGSSAGDWRLPNLFELESLRNMGNGNPCLPSGHPFNNVKSNVYFEELDSYYVWPVRGGH